MADAACQLQSLLLLVTANVSDLVQYRLGEGWCSRNVTGLDSQHQALVTSPINRAVTDGVKWRQQRV